MDNNTSSRSVGIVVDALKHLKESDGSKGRDICKYIASTYNSDFDYIKNKVKRALKRAVNMGIIRKTSAGLYVLINTKVGKPNVKKVCWYPGYRKGGKRSKSRTRRRSSGKRAVKARSRSKRRSRKSRKRPLLPRFSANRFSFTSLNGDAEMIVKELVHNIRRVQQGLAPNKGVVIKEIKDDKPSKENSKQKNSKTDISTANNSQTTTAVVSKCNSQETTAAGGETTNAQASDAAHDTDINELHKNKHFRNDS